MRAVEEIKGSKDPLIGIDQAAEALSVSPKSVKRAKQVHRDGAAELQEAMDHDEVPVTLAAEFVKAVPDKAKQKAVIESGKKTGDLRKAVQQEVKQQSKARAFNEDREGDRLADTIRAIIVQWPEDKREIAADIIRIVLDEYGL